MNKDLSINIEKTTFGGIMSKEQCLQLAKKIMNIYNTDKNDMMKVQDAGVLQSDCYRAMNIEFNPTQADVNTYAKIIDSDGKGKITVNDIQRLCEKYFGGHLANQDMVLREQKADMIELSPITNDESTPKNTKYQQYQSPYSRYSRKSTQGSQKSITSISQLQQPQVPVAQPQVVASSPQVKEIPKYSKTAEARLQVARRIFKTLDTENNGFITEKHVAPLLIQTYQNMGMSIEPTREDVDMWMEMADQDRDGKVHLIDYEALVLKSLQSQGIIID